MFMFLDRANGSIVLSFCRGGCSDLAGGGPTALAFVFSSIVSSLVSITRVPYFSVFV